MAILDETSRGSREKDPTFRQERKQRYFKDKKEQDFRPDMGGVPMTQGHYKATKDTFKKIDKEAEDYYRGATSKISEAAGSARSKAGNIRAEYGKFAPTMPETKKINVVIEDTHSARPEASTSYSGGSFTFDTKTTDNVSNRLANHPNVRIVPDRYGNQTMYVTKVVGGQNIANQVVETLQDAQSKYDSIIDQQLSAAQAEYDRDIASAEKRAGVAREGAYESIGREEQAALQMAHERREGILAQKGRIKGQMKSDWQRRIKVNDDFISNLVNSGVLKKKGKVK